MAYEKKEWFSGETVTASKLNHIEDGIDALDKGSTSKIDTLTNNLNSEIQTRTTETTTLKSRVDQIVAPTGEAPSAAEVTDARVGADGTIYDSVGNAIRTQIAGLKSQLTKFNSRDVLRDYVPIADASPDGITYHWDDDVCHVTGTATAISQKNIIAATTSLGPFVNGKKYYVRYSAKDVMLVVYFFASLNHESQICRYIFTNDGDFIVPANARSAMVRFRVNNGITVDEYVSPHILTAPGNLEIHSEVDNAVSKASDELNKKMSTGTVSGNGNPLVLEDTSEDFFESLSASGAGNPTVKCFGKNLARAINLTSTSLTRNNVNFTFDHSTGLVRIQSSGTGATADTVSGNYTVTINGVSMSMNYKFTAHKSCYVSISANATVQPPYIWEISDGAYTHCQMHVTYPSNGSNMAVRINKSITVHLNAGEEIGVRFYITKGWTGDMSFYPQIEIGAVPTAFEPVDYAWTTGLSNSAKNAFTLTGVTGEKILSSSGSVASVIDIDKKTLTINTARANNAGVIGNLYTSVENFAYLCHLSFDKDTRVFFEGIPNGSTKLKASIFSVESSQKKEIVLAEFGDGQIGTLAANTDYYYAITVYAGAVLDNVVIKPIIATGVYAIKAKNGTTVLTCDDDVTISAVAKTRSVSEIAVRVNKLADNLAKLTGDKVTPFINYGKLTKPIITFTDDDAASVESVTRYFNALNSVGAVGNYAIITDFMNGNVGEKDLLLSYEEKGWGCLYHCASQGADPSTEGAKYLKPYRDMEIAEHNFTRGLRAMNDAGFLAYKYWISPYGVDDDEMISMARRHGMQCLITGGTPGYITPSNCDRWHIPRWHFTPAEFASRGLTIFKELVAETVAQNGWLIILTHASEWDATTTMDTALADAASYAMSHGMEVRNFPDAFEIFRPFFYMNELF